MSIIANGARVHCVGENIPQQLLPQQAANIPLIPPPTAKPPVQSSAKPSAAAGAASGPKPKKKVSFDRKTWCL
jgi:hypothetical protein